MRAVGVVLVVATIGAMGGCDGTLAGIGRTPREPETPLPAAGAEAGAPVANPGPTTIAAKHLLVMHTGSRAAPRKIKRTREQARARAEEALAKIKAGEDFDKVVAEYTDEPGGAERHGDLGEFKRAAMVKRFSDAAFALDVGQVSGVVETEFGFHVIQRTK
jgi:uncharacterized protein YifE (UPF0438 family)